MRELAASAVHYVHGINLLTDKMATPWTGHPSWQGGVAMSGDGPAFAEQYPAG